MSFELFPKFLSCRILAVILLSASPSQVSYGSQQDWSRAFNDAVEDVVDAPRVILIEFAKDVRRFVPFHAKNEQVQEKVDGRKAYLHAKRLVGSLKATHAGRQLSRQDVAPVMGALMQYHESGEDSYQGLLEVYRELNTLRLSPLDKVECIRLIGQHEYFSGNFAEATQLFSQAESIDFRSLSDEEKEVFFECLGNVLYLNALSLSKQENKDVAAAEKFLKVVNDTRISSTVDPGTLANIYLRIGRIRFSQKDFKASASAFKSGIKVLDKFAPTADRADKQYRVSLEVEFVEADAMSKDSKSPDREHILKEFEKLEEKLSGRGYRDFDFLLQKRVLVAKEIGNEEYLTALQRLRDFYLKKRRFAGKLEYSETSFFLDVSSLLIQFHIKENNKENAKEVLKETKELVNPPRHWYLKFPKSFVDQALGESVLDK